MDTLIYPTVLYGSKVWGPCLLEINWTSVERVQILLLRRIIRCKQIIPQQIILAKFGARPLWLETIFLLVSLLHHIWSFFDSVTGQDRYLYLAYYSSESIALSSPRGHTRCWFARDLALLEYVGISIDQLPPFRYSMDAPGHPLPTRQELNRIIKDDIYKQFVQVTWTNPQGKLRPKMAFYVENYIEASSEWAHTDFKLRRTTKLYEQRGSARYVTFIR